MLLAIEEVSRAFPVKITAITEMDSLQPAQKTLTSAKSTSDRLPKPRVRATTAAMAKRELARANRCRKGIS